MPAVKVTKRMKDIVKIMTDKKARIEEERADEQSRYYLVKESDDGKHSVIIAEVTEGMLRKLQSANMIKSMDVGYYNWKSQKWTDPAEILDLPSRWDEYAEMRESMKREAQYRLGKRTDDGE